MAGALAGAMALFHAATASGAPAGCPRPETVPPQAYLAETQLDLPYCEAGGQVLRLDLARPKGASSAQRFPGIVFVHGGGWTSGNKTDYGWEIQNAAQRGFVAVTLQYRLAKDLGNQVTENPFPAQLEDVRCGIRWLRAHAEEYGVDPERIGITGASAGGHLSLLAGLQRTRDPSEQVQAIGNVYGPSDLMALYDEGNDWLKTVLMTVFGAHPHVNPRPFQLASPISYLRRSSPPILTVHGTRDTTVRFTQSKRLHKRARRLKADHQLVACPGEEHQLTDSSYRNAMDTVLEFFARNLAR
jgi:acetyl esterase/lipase